MSHISDSSAGRLEGFIIEAPPNPYMLAEQVLTDRDGNLLGFLDMVTFKGSDEARVLLGRYIYATDFDVDTSQGPLPLYTVREFELGDGDFTVRLVYRLRMRSLDRIDGDVGEFAAAARDAHVKHLKEIAELEPTQSGLLAKIGGHVMHLASSWLANAVVADGSPESHLRLQEQLEFTDFHPDYEYYLADFGQNDARRNWIFSEKTDPSVLWHHEVLQVEKVRAEFGLTGAGVRIGILDTGISPGSGLAPKLAGYAFVDQNARLHLNRPAAEPGSLSHGTHVAGSIVDSKYGIATDARIFLASVNNGAYGFAKWSQINAGLEWLVGERVDAINLSLGGPGYRTDLDEQLEVCRKRGIAVFAAIGNVLTGNTLYPGNSTLTTSVGAMARSGDLILRSGSDGNKPDLVAPGEEIVSTLRDGNFGPMSGTSQAAPQVTGVFALLREYRPDASTQQLLEAMIRTASSLPRVPRGSQGQGLIDLRACLNYLESLPASGGVPQEIARHEFADVEDIHIELASAVVHVVADRNDDRTVVEVSDNRTPLVRGIHLQTRNGLLVIYATPTQVGSDYVITISCPTIKHCRVRLTSGNAHLRGAINDVSVAVVSADVAVGDDESPLDVERCHLTTISGKIEVSVGRVDDCHIRYASLSGRLNVLLKAGGNASYSGAGTLGNSSAPTEYTLQTVSREMLIKELGILL